MRIGVLALQGGYELHIKKLRQLGADVLPIRKIAELDAIDGLIIPGGESSTLLKLCSCEFREAIGEKLSAGLPAFVTCAGLIFIAKKVENPAQESIGILDIDVKRNAYGRQVDSFITKDFSVTPKGSELIQPLNDPSALEAIFIRAPKIARIGEGIEVLIKYGDDPILVKQGNIIGATFHPELCEDNSSIHRFFLKLC